MTAPVTDAVPAAPASPAPAAPKAPAPAAPSAAATTDQHTGGMIALIPADPGAYAVSGGDDPADLHVTLVYLGDDVTKLPDEIVAALQGRVAAMAANWAPITSRITGYAVWNPDGGEDGTMTPATVYELDVATDGLIGIQDNASCGAADVMGQALFPAPTFPTFKPHMTAGYGLDAGKLTATAPVLLDTIQLALGGKTWEFPLTGGFGMGDSVYASYAAITADGQGEPADVDMPVPDIGPGDGIPVSFPVLIIEGMATGDGRFIESGALGHRALPLPILAQTANPVGGGGHDGASVIGRIDTLTRTPGPQVISKETGEPFPDDVFIWSATGFIDPDAPATALVQKRYLTGNSADLVDLDAEFVWDEFDDSPDPSQIRMKGGTIAATTLCPIPAFADAYISLDGTALTPADDMPAELVASAVPSWRSPDVGDDCLPCQAFAVPTAAKRKAAVKNGHAMPDGSYPIDTSADLTKAIKAVGRGGTDHDDIRKHIIKQAKRLKLDDQVPANWKPDGSITAAAVPEMFPPAHAFADPVFDEITPLRLDDASLPGGFTEISGHLATWGTCHTGYAGQCVTPPQSATDYAYFHSGAVRVRDADRVFELAAGHITMGEGGHAGMQLSAAEAAAHYDNTNTVVADVTAGEDQFGIWVHGVLRRSATPEQVEALRASPLSGDWRDIGGTLEMVAALAVNSGGFPVPRARVASGSQFALVAAGVVPTGKTPPVPAKPAAAPAKASPNAENAALAEAIATLVVAKMKAADDAEDTKDTGDDTGDAKPDVVENSLALRDRAARARMSL